MPPADSMNLSSPTQPACHLVLSCYPILSPSTYMETHRREASCSAPGCSVTAACAWPPRLETKITVRAGDVSPQRLPPTAGLVRLLCGRALGVAAGRLPRQRALPALRAHRVQRNDVLCSARTQLLHVGGSMSWPSPGMGSAAGRNSIRMVKAFECFHHG